MNYSTFLKDHAIIPFLLVMAVLCWFDFKDRYTHKNLIESVNGSVLSAEHVWQGSSRSQSAGKVLRIKYSFQYANQGFINDRIFAISREISSAEETALIKAFREGQAVKVSIPRGVAADAFLLAPTSNQLFEATFRWLCIAGAYLVFLLARLMYLFAQANWMRVSK